MEHKKTDFPIAMLDRDDILEDTRINVDGRITRDMLTDDIMEQIARKLADDYLDQLFWISLEIITDNVLEQKS